MGPLYGKIKNITKRRGSLSASNTDCSFSKNLDNLFYKKLPSLFYFLRPRIWNIKSSTTKDNPLKQYNSLSLCLFDCFQTPPKLSVLTESVRLK